MPDSPGLFTLAEVVANNVAIVPSQIVGDFTNGAATISCVMPGNVTNGNSVLIGMDVFGGGGIGYTFAAGDITKSAGTSTIGTPALDTATNAALGVQGVAIYRVPITGTGSLTLLFTRNSAFSYAMIMGSAEFSGLAASPFDAGGANNATGTAHTTGSIVTAFQGMMFYVGTELSGGNFTRTWSDTLVFQKDTGASTYTGIVQYKIVTSSPNTMTDNTGADSSAWIVQYGKYKTS